MLGEVVFLVGELLLFFTQQVVLHAQIFLDASLFSLISF